MLAEQGGGSSDRLRILQNEFGFPSNEKVDSRMKRNALFANVFEIGWVGVEFKQNFCLINVLLPFLNISDSHAFGEKDICSLLSTMPLTINKSNWMNTKASGSRCSYYNVFSDGFWQAEQEKSSNKIFVCIVYITMLFNRQDSMFYVH